MASHGALKTSAHIQWPHWVISDISGAQADARLVPTADICWVSYIRLFWSDERLLIQSADETDATTSSKPLIASTSTVPSSPSGEKLKRCSRKFTGAPERYGQSQKFSLEMPT
jgi:hypothetical protein